MTKTLYLAKKINFQATCIDIERYLDETFEKSGGIRPSPEQMSRKAAKMMCRDYSTCFRKLINQRVPFHHSISYLIR